MGIDLALYRARIGCFLPARRPTTRSKEKYTRFTTGSDIHLRTFICCITVLMLSVSYLGLVAGRYYCIETFAVSESYNCMSDATHDEILPYRSPTYVDLCDVYSNQYARLVTTRLLLSSDVELNPGPSEDTLMILNAIEKTNDELASIKSEVASVRNEVRGLKDNIDNINTKLNDVEYSQKKLGEDIDDIKARVSEIEYCTAVINDDLSALSIQDEVNSDRLSKLEAYINKAESDKVKCSLRIFGLSERESDECPLEAVVEKDVLRYPKYATSPLISARRVGSFDDGEPRMVVATFKSFSDKAKLFEWRDKLRENNIRISNDLTYYQRQQLKDLKSRGLRGRFEYGKLVHVPMTSINKGRVFKRANRQLDTVSANGKSTPMDVVISNDAIEVQGVLENFETQ